MKKVLFSVACIMQMAVYGMEKGSTVVQKEDPSPISKLDLYKGYFALKKHPRNPVFDRVKKEQKDTIANEVKNDIPHPFIEIKQKK